ncbi:sn-glycerol-3-phosphate ABC transporter permease UgpE [Chelatococcus daeguensis]|uniref:sn-glycerol-3-phosphate transport system permease protein UgpE n=2 Tax=Chelatococcus TaxID=28209 RepID=A0AAC9NXC8_9HYPH|nr:MULTISPECIES: sn-glycerol-3-phosphate ABC transporter permease UgpE [Chelatococcus]APF36127.1 glycerol-3-phosphate transporter [Chelatococcus daeguensis]KZE34766.1 glycerol-3-phosphate transporter [Chelatococcus daeguensis]MBM3082618.1 sn-glycerol-3-phosphate ABC transporter permease UgpE [Chelatococcus daeguensis]CUA88828.1 carbohydrate ABC transporter membrane protein 2, CUT1 family (TC 3.A.1.1.-) [Chelatococcus sambhunathii]
MVESGRKLTFAAHAALILGVAAMVLPVWLAFVASTHPGTDFLTGRIGFLPGAALIANYKEALFTGSSVSGFPPVGPMLWNSFVMAMAIAIGKIAISLLSAFAICYFRFPFRVTAFWLIFITLMLPVEVRILPTFEVVANLGMLNSYSGLAIPLIASATATFLFRQVFMTIPDELTEAARIDGAGPLRFFWSILMPLSRTNIAALFVILFIYGWNQYLWPLLVTTDQSYYTIVMGIQRLAAAAAEADPVWHLVMTTTILAMLPPVVVVIAMQRLFVKGLVETEK